MHVLYFLSMCLAVLDLVHFICLMKFTPSDMFFFIQQDTLISIQAGRQNASQPRVSQGQQTPDQTTLDQVL